MASKSKQQNARKTLQKLSALPDIPNKVGGASIEENRSEVAHIDDWTRLAAEESIATETVPVSTYRAMEAHHVDFHTRHDNSHTGNTLESNTVEAIEKEIPPETCSDCGGEGTNQCGDCSGRSYLPCPNDCGNGRVRCPSCQGTLSVSCRSCSGNGRTKCSNCSGDGRTNCRNCNYNGNATCPGCKGSFFSGEVRCKTCHGDGTTGSGDFERSCPDCHGDGRRTCHQCHGDGKISCQKCGGVGSDPCTECSGGTIPCSSCSGSGSKACTRCSNGTVICEKCSGESTVPCGCGDGRVDCDTCETDGELVTAKTAVIEYTVVEESTVHSTLVSDHSLLTRADASETVIHNDVDVDTPEVDGSWIEADRRNRHTIPVQHVKYRYRETDYEVYNINGKLHSPSAPESDRLKSIRKNIREQRHDLQDAYDDRIDCLEQAIDDQRSQLVEHYKARERKVKFARAAKAVIAIFAIGGLYLLW